MKISLSWLKRYVDIDVPVQELCDKMVMSGFEVESIEDLSASMSRVVAGRIVKLEKHPDADKLQICQIDVGESEPVQIVTGASNVFDSRKSLHIPDRTNSYPLLPMQLSDRENIF